MKKSVLLILVLLIPLAYADPVLDAQKASLDVEAYEYVIKMDAAIEFAEDHNISTKELVKLRNDFVEENNKALETNSKDEFKTNEGVMRNLSKRFKNETRNQFEYLLDDAKKAIKFKLNQKKDDVKEKIKVAVDKRKDALVIALDSKIQQLGKYVEEQEKIGKEPKTYKILLDRFHKERGELNETTYSQSLWHDDNTIEKIGTITSVAKETLSDIFAQIGGKGHE